MHKQEKNKNKRKIQSKEGLLGINISKKNIFPSNGAKNLIVSVMCVKKNFVRLLCTSACVTSSNIVSKN